MNNERLRYWQLRVFILCWLAYSCIYFGRVNLSIALPYIENSFQLSRTEVGLIGSLFFWIYGIGQLTNGYIGDRLSGRFMVFTGLIVTAISNILFGFSNNYYLMLVLWGVNGYFQSMLWGPMAKTLSNWYPQSKMNGVVVAISTSMIAGYSLSWSISGNIISHFSWRWVFIIPGLIILLYSFIWLTKTADNPKDAGFEITDNIIEHSSDIKEEELNKEYSGISLLSFINKTKLWLIVVACFAQGIIKEGVGLWTPTFVMETHNIDIVSTGFAISIIPFINLAGMLFAGWLNKQFKYKEKITIISLFAFGIAMLAGLITFGRLGLTWALLFLSLSSGAMYGVNVLLIGLIPMKYAKYNKVSSVAGFLDFCSYIATGIAASLTGLIVEYFGWFGVMFTWMLIAMAGIISLIISWRIDEKENKLNLWI
ncbi:MAG TPA: MFS transporter [Clostridiaceae bacterium]|nr:MFS transporter [Clostridiaceae bacterium]